MRVSIIIPVYNTERYLKECLDSITSQSYRKWECILVDDGSKDGSLTICNEYAKKDRRFKVIHKENGGVSSARNVGLENSTGDWIYFCDSDDKLHDENSLSCLLELSEHADLAVCSYVALDDNGKCVNGFVSPERPYIGELNGKQYFYKRLASDLNLDYIGFLWNKIFKRDIIQKNKLYFAKDIKFAEDLLFVTQYICTSDCSNIAINHSKIIYDYIQHKNSAMGKLSKQYNPAFFTDFIAYERVLDSIHNRYHDNALDIAMRNKLCMQGLYHLDMMEDSHYPNMSQKNYIKEKIQSLEEYRRAEAIHSLGKTRGYSLTLSVDERAKVTNEYLHSKHCHYTYLNYKWKIVWIISHIAGERGLRWIKI